MTWTKWKSPRKTQELETNEISFNDEGNPKTIVSNKPISAVSNYFGGLYTVESSAILFSDFGFDVDSTKVEEIELFLHVSRLGRTQDKTISLYMGKQIGKNRADLEAEDEHIYRGGLEAWKIASAKIMDYSSPEFGVVIDLQPHTQYPSNVTVYIRKVALRLKLK